MSRLLVWAAGCVARPTSLASARPNGIGVAGCALVTHIEAQRGDTKPGGPFVIAVVLASRRFLGEAFGEPAGLLAAWVGAIALSRPLIAPVF